MEHPCPKCGTSVVNGTPFCSQCGAPQIRVSIEMDSPPTTEPLPPGTPEDMQPPAEPVTPPVISSMPLPPMSFPGAGPERIKWREALIGVLIAGIVGGFATLVFSAVIPFLPFTALCMIACGGIAVSLYGHRAHAAHVRPSQGFRIGALSGVVGFLLTSIIALIDLTSAYARSQIRLQIQAQANKAIASATDAASKDAIRSVVDRIATDSGLFSLFLLFLAIFGVLFIFLSGFGGLLGAWLFGRKPLER